MEEAAEALEVNTQFYTPKSIFNKKPCSQFKRGENLPSCGHKREEQNQKTSFLLSIFIKKTKQCYHCDIVLEGVRVCKLVRELFKQMDDGK